MGGIVLVCSCFGSELINLSCFFALRCLSGISVGGNRDPDISSSFVILSSFSLCSDDKELILILLTKICFFKVIETSKICKFC